MGFRRTLRGSERRWTSAWGLRLRVGCWVVRSVALGRWMGEWGWWRDDLCDDGMKPLCLGCKYVYAMGYGLLHLLQRLNRLS